MNYIIYQILFLFITLYILLRAVAYAIYEIQTLKNKTGGITVIVISTLIVVFVNIIMFFK